MATFKELRQKKGYNHAEFASLAGISTSTLSRLENGGPVSRITAGKVCRVLGVDIDVVEGLNIIEDSPTHGDSKKKRN